MTRPRRHQVMGGTWPFSSDDWDAQMMFFVLKGYRVVGHDRSGHGRHSQVSGGHDMDHYAAVATAVYDRLSLTNAVHGPLARRRRTRPLCADLAGPPKGLTSLSRPGASWHPFSGWSRPRWTEAGIGHRVGVLTS